MPKKKHWTQTPEGKLKLKNMRKKDNIGLGTMPEKIEQNQCNKVTSAQRTPNQYVDVMKPIRDVWELTKFMEEFFEKGVALSRRKNHDYAGNGDPFYNFRRFGMQGFIVRMGDKFARLETLATHGYLAVTEESYQDTLIDIANYAALLAAFLYNQRIEVEEANAKSR